MCLTTGAIPGAEAEDTWGAWRNIKEERKTKPSLPSVKRNGPGEVVAGHQHQECWARADWVCVCEEEQKWIDDWVMGK
jgi:hypothetical protein